MEVLGEIHGLILVIRDKLFKKRGRLSTINICSRYCSGVIGKRVNNVYNSKFYDICDTPTKMLVGGIHTFS